MGRLVTFIYDDNRTKVFSSSEISVRDKDDNGVLTEIITGPRLRSMMEGPRYSTAVYFEGRVLLIGGMNSDCTPKNDVISYPISSSGRSCSSASLLSPKSYPLIIVAHDKIYAFDQPLSGPGGGGGVACEVMINYRWFEVKLPTFPPPRNVQKPSSSFSYLIHAYAPSCFTNGVYISIENVCSYYVHYDSNSSESVWTVSPHEFRFWGEAKNLGDTDKYVGFSRNPDKIDCICVYKLVPDTGDGHVFSFDEISFFTMPSIPFSDCYSNNMMFQTLSDDTFCLVNCRVDPNTDLQHFIVVQIFKLPKDKSVSTSTRKRTREEDSNEVKLLGYTCYPNVALPDTWVFVR